MRFLRRCFPTALSLWVGPVLRLEMRSRMRGPRTVIIQTAFMAVLVVTFYFAYRIVLSNDYYQRNLSAYSQMGRKAFLALAAMECALIMLLAPTFSCATITSEHENGTFELLRTSLLDPGAILFGKFVASLYYILLLVFSSVPILSACLMLGGLSPLQIGLSFLILLGTLFSYGWLGLFFSVMAKRTSTAAALSYVTTIAINALPVGLVKLLSGVDRDFHAWGFLAECSSPLSNLEHVLHPEYHVSAMKQMWNVPGGVFTWTFHGLMAIVMGIVMWRRLRRELGAEPRGFGPGNWVERCL
ncbi:MAG: ABC transporter permease subunit [Planctomycetes bacterium]|nr:ABC transporter permease subunit [Planctomycetota bacterium]